MDSLTFISDICGQLKKLKRTGWVRHNIPLPESDSDHMHRCAMCALLLTQPPDPRDDYSSPSNQKFHPSKINTTKLLRMAVTHDLCESIAGDITPHCDSGLIASKYDKEEEAMKKIREIVGDPLGLELFELWKEYEEQETVEALYCKDIDKFEMIVQGYEYEKEHLQHKQKEDESNGDESDEKRQKIKEEEAHKKDVRNEPLRGFFVSTNKAIKSPLFRRLDKELRERREVMLQEKGWSVTEEERQRD